MKIVQTFWSGNGNLLSNPYGWLEPQYHLMAWALSCLTLREHYDEVIMYTDSEGESIFNKQLKLPYTKFIVQYDNLQCPNHQWAYSKILTYSLQDQPFIHVDGDVFLPKKFNPSIGNAALIAQNKEIGTDYYRKMIDAIKDKGIITPNYLEDALQKEFIPSYNAGVIGGHDIKFIQEYCNAAFEFIETNKLLDIPTEGTSGIISHNILFEQILFYAIASKYNKSVTTAITKEIKDNGYSYNDFCNFYSFDDYTLMHIIGGHKRRKRTCELLSRTLLTKYPEYYQRIVELFPEKHKRIFQKKNNSPTIVNFEKFISKINYQWKDITNEDLLEFDKQSCNYFDFLKFSYQDQSPTIIKKNPYLAIYKEQDPSQYNIAAIPTLLYSGIQTIPIDDLSYNILQFLDGKKTFKDLLNELELYFKSDEQSDKKHIYRTTLKAIENLFFNRLIYIDNKTKENENK